MKKTILLLLMSPVAFAAGKMDARYPLATSGGIVAPSTSTAVFQNPAAMSSTSGLNIIGQGGWDTSFGNGTYGGGLQYGNMSFGLGAGISTAPSSSTTSAYGGLGVMISSIKTSIGVAGNMGISPSGSSNINAGVLIMPSDRFQLGFTAMGLTGSAMEFGAGLGLGLTNGVKLVVDGSTNTATSSFNVKPGLLLSDQRVGATISYGLGTASSLQLINGFTAGFFVMLGNTLQWQVYYNEINPIFTSLQIRI